MKLILEHIIPYLPYALFGMFMGKRDIVHEVELENGLITGLNSNTVELKNFKPILRPLSDLTKEIEVNGKNIAPSDYFHKYGMQSNLFYIKYNLYGHLKCNYDFINKLFKWHFDVFGLIPKGLAIDINTIKK